MCFSTVRCDIPSAAAISLFVMPSMRLILNMRAVCAGRRSHSESTSSIIMADMGDSFDESMKSRMARFSHTRFCSIDSKFMVLKIILLRRSR